MRNIKIPIVFLFLATGFVIENSAAHDIRSNHEIRSPSKQIDQVSKGLISAEGRWKQTTQKGFGIIPKINTTSFLCDKVSMVCNETIVKLSTPKDSQFETKPILYFQTFTYKIIKWNSGVIKAIREASVAEISIRIILSETFAEKTFRELNSNVFYRWVLE